MRLEDRRPPFAGLANHIRTYNEFLVIYIGSFDTPSTKQAVVLPQNPRNAQKLLAEKGLPQIAQIYTDVGGYGILPYPRSH